MDSRLTPDSYDLVHTRWTLMHIPQREAVLARLGSLLKPGGRMLLEEADGLPVEALPKSRHEMTTDAGGGVDRAMVTHFSR